MPNALEKGFILWKSKLFLYPLLVEPHNPAVADLDHRHSRLACLADHVPRRLRVTLEVNLLERYSLLPEIPLRSATPRLTVTSEQHHLGHQFLLYDIDLQMYISGKGFAFLAASGRILRSAQVRQGGYSSSVAQLNFG